jgi:glucosamine--fructose-6-phosphate aminotransferase (isomerizing)
VLRQNDQAAVSTDELIRDLRDAGNTVFTAGGPASTLPWIGDDNPVFDPITMLMPTYLSIELAARCRSYDPDNPPFLSKVTRTL